MGGNSNPLQYFVQKFLGLSFLTQMMLTDRQQTMGTHPFSHECIIIIGVSFMFVGQISQRLLGRITSLLQIPFGSINRSTRTFLLPRILAVLEQQIVAPQSPRIQIADGCRVF